MAFYNWRLFASKLCDLDVIVDSSSSTFQWYSEQYGNSRYTLPRCYQSVEEFTKSNSSASAPIDLIVFSASSLQEISTLCESLRPVLTIQLSMCNKAPIVVVETSYFVNLEPFVQMTLQNDDVHVLSVMCDFDVRAVGTSAFQVCPSKKESELCYVGKSGTSDSYSQKEIALINKVSDLFESAGIDVYKLGTPLEFLSYQWKFALPKIAIEPLSIIFEKAFPKQLQEQILAKPLISGLILEVITIIKVMGCKLFKSYDSETSLMDRYCQLFPSMELDAKSNYMDTPRMFYDFYNNNELYLDLLLLQPILLADDYQIKTPYLEFLYAILTQFKNNSQTSIFWLKKTDENAKALKLQQDEISLKNKLKEQHIQEMQTSMASIKINGHQENGTGTQPITPTTAMPPAATSNYVNSPNMEDMADIAVYGATLNGEKVYDSPQPAPTRNFPPRSRQPSQQYDPYGNMKSRDPNIPGQMPGPNSSSPTFPPPQQQHQYHGPPSLQNAPRAPRRMSSFPSHMQQSAQPYSDPSVDMGMQARFKPTSRKNRKSAFPAAPSEFPLRGGEFNGMPRPMPQNQRSMPFIPNKQQQQLPVRKPMQSASQTHLAQPQFAAKFDSTPSSSEDAFSNEPKSASMELGEPKGLDSTNDTLQVPKVEPKPLGIQPKPLGATSGEATQNVQGEEETGKKKKKRGFFGKKKK